MKHRVIWSSVTTKKLCKKNFYQSIFLYRDTATKTLKLLQHYVHHISQCPRFQKTTKWKNIHHCSCNSSIVEEGFFWLLLTKQDCINLCLFPMFFTLFWSTQPTPSYMGEKIKLCKWMTGITGRSTSCLLLHQSLLKYRKHKFWSLLMWALYIHINCTRIFKKKISKLPLKNKEIELLNNWCKESLRENMSVPILHLIYSSGLKNSPFCQSTRQFAKFG